MQYIKLHRFQLSKLFTYPNGFWTEGVRIIEALLYSISYDDPVTPGVYLPLLWEASFCWKTPIALAYTRGHFSALVAMTTSQPSGAEVHSNMSHDNHVMYLPLTDNDGHLLQVHFLTEQEVSCYSNCIRRPTCT